MAKYVFRILLDYEQEEAWLNQMAEEGWMVESFHFGLYRFSKGTPGEYTYRIELLPHLARSAKNRPYLSFVEETDVEVVYVVYKWAIYRKKTCDGRFDVFTDTKSRIAHYRRVSRLMLFITCLQWGLALFYGGSAVYAIVLARENYFYLPDILPFLLCSLLGTLFFRAMHIKRKKYKRLIKEESFLE